MLVLVKVVRHAEMALVSSCGANQELVTAEVLLKE